MARIWGIIRIKEKIATDIVVELEDPCLDGALDVLCQKFDIPRPVVLKKHRNEYARFSHTRYKPDDFVETVHFASFEVELLHDKKKSDKNQIDD